MIKVGCWNIRGLNDSLKQKEVRQLITKGKLHLIGILETKVVGNKKSSIQSAIMRDWEWTDNSDLTNGGRIWVGWNPTHVKVNICSRSAQAITITAKWDSGFSCSLSFIYGSSSYMVRRELWREIEDFSSAHPWALLGDYNATLHAQERIGNSDRYVGGMDEFLNCVTQAGLYDCRYRGNYFTWSNKQAGSDRVVSKIDRVLVNGLWMQEHPNAEAEFMNPGVSDHTPMVLSLYDNNNRGPMPFKFFNYWVYEKDFNKIVENVWNTQVFGNPMFKLVHKLKILKQELTAWRKNNFNTASSNVEQARQRMCTAQQVILRPPVSDIAVQAEKFAVKEYACAARNEEAEAKQKARSMSFALGDQNTSYFHGLIRERRAQNRIMSIFKQDGTKLEEPADIENECLQYFGDVFTGEHETQYDPNIINSLEFQGIITEELGQNLIRPVTRNEIVETLAAIDSNKAPGPDGFSSFFFKAAWRIVGDDFVRAILNFFRSSKLLGQVNATIVALVPKVTNASYFSDYRPIACCNVLYKCITKLLTNRMQDVVHRVVSNSQSAFIKGRHIQDNIMLAHELVRNYHRDHGPPRCAAKIDLRKAYDMVRWEAITHLLEKLNFPTQFIMWVKECISTSKFSINLNGSPRGYIHASRGLRQGCPLSPYLFVMVMEILHELLKKKVQDGHYKLHYRCKDPIITHLGFADDLIAFFHGDGNSAKALAEVLQEFKVCTGLEVNNNKSSLFLAGVSSDVKMNIGNYLQFQVEELPVKYLGLPMISSTLSHSQCSPLLERIRKRVNSWKNKSLSYAGRLVLIKSVLASMHVYWTSCYGLPKQTLECINALLRNFLWSAGDSPLKKAKVSWDSICYPTCEGGLGIRNIRVGNEVASLKHIWNLISRQDTLWVHWTWKHLVKQRDFWLMKPPREASWCWRRILECRAKATTLLTHSIGNGEATLLWKDPWHPIGILMELFPHDCLYDSILHRNARVSSFIRNDQWWTPSRLAHRIPEIVHQLGDVELSSNSDDKVVWKASHDGSFQTKATYEAIRKRKSIVQWASVIWFKHNIPRQSFITWLLTNKALTTLNKLKKWGKAPQDICPLCGYESETESHLFFLCSYSSAVWGQILNFLQYSKSIHEWEEELQWCIQQFRGKGATVTLKKVALNATVYHIWMERNRRLYEQKFSIATELGYRIYMEIRIKFSVGTWKAADTEQNRNLMQRWNLDFQLSNSLPRQCSWTKPPLGWHKINTDGSFRSTGDIHAAKGGYGAILRDDTGDAIAACSGDCRGHSVIKHELQGILAGLKLATLHNKMRLEISTDSSTVFSYLTTQKPVSWELRHIVCRIRTELSKLEEYACKHDYRETNRAADLLASTFPNSEFIEFTPSSFAEDLKKIVYEDRVGKVYLRL